MSPKIIDKNQKTKDIAKAALSVFSKNGFNRTRIEHIANAAGIGKGTIYEYFETKESVFIAAILEWNNQVDAQLVNIVKDISNPINRLFAIVEEGFEICNPENSNSSFIIIEIFQQTFIENGAFSKKRHILKNISDGFRLLIKNTLQNGIAKNIFKPEIKSELEIISTNIYAFFNGILLRKIISGEPVHYKENVNHFLNNLIMNIVINPIDKVDISPHKFKG